MKTVTILKAGMLTLLLAVTAPTAAATMSLPSLTAVNDADFDALRYQLLYKLDICMEAWVASQKKLDNKAGKAEATSIRSLMASISAEIEYAQQCISTATDINELYQCSARLEQIEIMLADLAAQVDSYVSYLVFQAPTAEGIQMTFCIIDKEKKLVQVGTGGGDYYSIPTATTGHVTIPATVNGYQVTELGGGAFWYCSGITSVSIPDGVTSIGASAFRDCGKLESVSIPASLREIDPLAFDRCFSLKALNLPDDMTYIGWGAFSDCRSLATVNIPNGLTTLSNSAFYNCQSLRSITIPKGITAIESGVFAPCRSLETVVTYIQEPFDITDKVFTGLDFTQAVLYVPAGTKSRYQAATGWNKFQHIVEMGDNGFPPADEGSDTDFGNAVGEGTDLDGQVIGKIYYCISSTDGGYDSAEGCLVVNKVTDDSAIDGSDIFSDAFKAGYAGIVLMVSPGKGTVKVKAETVGDMLLKVKIGSAEPIALQPSGGSSLLTVPYDVSQYTYIYVYGGAASAAPATTRAAASRALKLYSVGAEKSATGISRITADGQVSDDTWYTLDGRRLSGQPVRKGLYINRGRTVIVK